MREHDFCPFCDGMIATNDLIETDDYRGCQQEIFICPHCKRFIRVNFETRIHISVKSEDDYLSKLKDDLVYYQKLLEIEERMENTYYYKERIIKIKKQIEGVEERMRYNSTINGIER